MALVVEVTLRSAGQGLCRRVLAGSRPTERVALETTALAATTCSSGPPWVLMVIEIGAAEELLGIDLGLGQMRAEVFPQGVELGRRHGRVIVPPDGVFCGGIADHEFVFCGPASMLARLHHQWSVFGDFAFATAVAQIPQDGNGSL